MIDGMKIVNKDGSYRQYIYKSDIANYLHCDAYFASDIFDKVKQLEQETLAYEMFEKRVPQDLFHKFRNKKKETK